MNHGITTGQIRTLHCCADPEKQPTLAHGSIDGTTLGNLGYLVYDTDRNQYGITAKGSEYLNTLSRKARERRFRDMTSAERAYAAKYIYNPSHIKDFSSLIDLADGDRNAKVRAAAFEKLLQRKVIHPDLWNYFARSRDREIRMMAAKVAAPEAYADEKDPDIVSEVIRRHKEQGIPRKVVEAWCGHGIASCVEAMTTDDIDMALDSGTPEIIALVAEKLAAEFTPEQVDRLCSIADEHPHSEHIQQALLSIGRKGNHLKDEFIDKYTSDRPWDRLYRYRAAYRTLKEMERMFADPDGDLARSQRELALREMAR